MPMVKDLFRRLFSRRTSRYRYRSQRLYWPSYIDEDGRTNPGHYPAPHPEDKNIPRRFVCPHGRLVSSLECGQARKGDKIMVTRPLVPRTLLKRDFEAHQTDMYQTNKLMRHADSSGHLYVWVLSLSGAMVPVRVDGRFADTAEDSCQQVGTKHVLDDPNHSQTASDPKGGTTSGRASGPSNGHQPNLLSADQTKQSVREREPCSCLHCLEARLQELRCPCLHCYEVLTGISLLERKKVAGAVDGPAVQ